MSLRFGILGFLNYAPMSGYDLTKAFGDSLDFFWHAQNSQIYQELKRLERQGYISGQTVIQSDRPNKRIFAITEAGQRALLDWLAREPGEEAPQFKSAFLMKVFFCSSLPPAQSAAMLDKFQRDCEAYLERMRSVPESIRNYGADMAPYQTLCWELTADFGYRLIQMCIDWAGQSIRRLEDTQ